MATEAALRAELEQLRQERDRYRKALERLAQVMPFGSPLDPPAVDLRARIFYARQVLKPPSSD